MKNDSKLLSKGRDLKSFILSEPSLEGLDLERDRATARDVLNEIEERRDGLPDIVRDSELDGIIDSGR